MTPAADLTHFAFLVIFLGGHLDRRRWREALIAEVAVGSISEGEARYPNFDRRGLTGLDDGGI
jgi:hypothetical protein